ncbi:MAG: hypothetical protein PSV22_20185, partial [Pseudolabrys sp.]|nr:hypothetical protein [Pseudolabrys sp.]
CGRLGAAANGASGVAAKATLMVAPRAAAMAVQASRRDFAEFMIDYLRMGAGFPPSRRLSGRSGNNVDA